MVAQGGRAEQGASGGRVAMTKFLALTAVALAIVLSMINELNVRSEISEIVVTQSSSK